MSTYVENLKLKLGDIALLVHELLDSSRIKSFVNDPNSDFVVIGGPSYYWDNPSEKEQRIQMKLIPKYSRWIESFKVLLENLSEPTKEKLIETDTFFNNWINKHGDDWNVPKNVLEAKEKFDEQVSIFYKTLEMFNSAEHKETILIPDTNSLIASPDPASYRQISASETFTLVFIPTVLSELDELKVKSSNVDFKNKVKSVITRIKGYRNQGSMLDGITVHKTITLKMIPVEPNFNKSLSWLTETNNDDRIIASVLEIQREFPSSRIVLVTADINLQNKCEMAYLPYEEIEVQ